MFICRIASSTEIGLTGISLVRTMVYSSSSISGSSAQLTYDSYVNVAMIGAAQSQAAVNISRIYTVASTATMYLVANQNSGGSKSLTASRNKLTAICIG